MFKFIIGAIIFGLIALAVIILVVINFTYKGVRQMRKAAQDQFELNQKRKEQKEKNPFGEDYFKSSDSGSRQSHQSHQTHQAHSSQSSQQSNKNTARKTTTSSGVTIIDEREADKKIFNHDDGEYVEFEEV